MEDDVRRGTWRLIFGGLLGFLLGAAAGLGLFRHHTTPAELDALFRERIPVGSSSHRVEAFLDSIGVHHGSEPGERTINATWRSTRVGLVSTTDIGVTFYFDERRRLVRYELEEWSTYL